MTKMMADMTVKPTGDVDRDFVDMMIPHHQGAIDMAQSVLRYGHNDSCAGSLRKSSSTQQQEITAMRLAIGEPVPPSAPAPTTAASTRRPAADMQIPTIMKIGASSDETQSSIVGLLAVSCRSRHAPAWAGQAPGAASDPDIPSAIATASTPPSSFPTRSRSPIPSTTSCSA